jgi:hypothetical protein
MTKWFIEIRGTPQRSGAPRLVPLEDSHKYTGFRSVYAYNSDVAALINSRNSTADLRDQSVYSDTLFVDFDNTDPEPLCRYLIENGIRFERWDSGNRSTHLHIGIEPMFGVWVPASQKAWMKEHAPEADLSFYHQSGQYRLPRTYHAKTGKPKKLIAEYAGSLLIIPQAEQEQTEVEIQEGGDKTTLAMLLLASRGEGKRRPHLFQLGVSALECGYTYEESLNHLRFWNSRMSSEPHTEQVLRQQLDGAYKYVSRRSHGRGNTG